MEAPAAAASAPATPEPPAAQTAAATPTAATPTPPPVQVVAGENTPLEGAAPSLHVRSPRDGQLIKGDKVELTLDVKNWVLTPEGKHIHLIVDNEPYIAVRDTTKPIDLRALMQKDLGHDLTEGTHVVRAFPGRAQHESVKEAGAFDVRTFSFKKRTADFKFDPKAPLLTYSRPKGCVDLGTRALLDFYVTNTKLSPTESRVHYTIDGTTTGDIIGWTPHYIENLPEGEHHIELTLQDANGAPLAGPYNDTSRTFHVAKDCKASATAAAAATPAGSPAPASSMPAAIAPAPTASAPASQTMPPKAAHTATPAASTPAH